MPLSPDIISDLAPTGVLRAGINLSNFLLVTKVNSTGDPEGVAPDLAGEVAMRLGVSVKYVTFKSPGELADAVDKDIWDIGLIGAEPQRAETIAFTPAYAEIEATYLVPSGSRLENNRRRRLRWRSDRGDRSQCLRSVARSKYQAR